MTNLDPSAYSKNDNAFVPNASNPFLSGGILDAGQDLVGAPPSGPQMMPVGSDYFSDLLGLGLESQPQTFKGEDLGDGASPVLQALANELAPIYPQVAKALTAPTLDNALQSGVELFSRSSQLLEDSMASGKLTATETAQDIGRSVRELVDSALARWRAEDNAARTGLTKQAEAFLSELKIAAAEVDDSRWMAKAKHRLASARQGVEAATDGVYRSLGYVGNTPVSKEEEALEQAQSRLRSTLVDLRDSPDLAWTFETAFGDSGTPTEAKAVIDNFVEDVGPEIAVVDASALLGEGAFGDDTIFVSDEVIADAAENPAAIDSVLLEEVGHYFDQVLNTIDSAGDEGAIFARLVQGEAISASEMLNLKKEDDTSTLLFNNKAISVENQVLEGESSMPILGSDRGMHMRSGTAASFDQAFATKKIVVSPPTNQPSTPTQALPESNNNSTPVDGSDRKLYLKSGTVASFDQAFAQQPKPSTPVAQSTVPTFTEEEKTSGGGASTVQVESGDTLWEIAAQNGVSWTDLRKPDGTAFTEADARSLQVGADVVLPENPVEPAPTSPPTIKSMSEQAAQLTSDAALLSTASPYASQAMEQQAEQLIAKEKRETIKSLQDDAELLSTTSPYASQAMQAEAKALIAEDALPEIERLTRDSELLSTASPYASQAMQKEAVELEAEERRQEIVRIETDSELLSTASPYASQVMQQEATRLIASEDNPAPSMSVSSSEAMPSDDRFNDVTGDQSDIHGWDLSTTDESDALYAYAGEDGEGSWVTGAGVIDYEASDEDAWLAGLEILTAEARGNLIGTFEQGDFWGVDVDAQVIETDLNISGHNVNAGFLSVDGNYGGTPDEFGIMFNANVADIKYENGAPSAENSNDIQVGGGFALGWGGGLNLVSSDPDSDGIMNFGFDASVGPVDFNANSEYVGQKVEEGAEYVVTETVESKGFVEKLLSGRLFG